MDDSSYVFNIHDGSAATINTCNFNTLKNVIYIHNSNVNVFNNRLTSVSKFITQNNHVYARVFGNMQRADNYANCTLPHPEVIHLTIDNIASYGNTSNRPAGSYIGQLYYNTQTSHLDVFNGSNWI